MDFTKMMNAAAKNAQKSEKEVDRIREEVNQEKSEHRRQLEAQKMARLEMQRRKMEKEKEMARRKEERQEEERRKNFTIPKRNDSGPSTSSSVNTSALRAVIEKQRAEKELTQKKQEADKQKLMMLRMQANGGKATKKMGKQFGLDVIDLQTRFGGNNEHLEVLQKRKWKEEEDQDMEADKYRSGVYKAMAAKQKNEGALRSTVAGPHRVSTSKSNSLAGLCSRHERTRDTFSPPKDGKKVQKAAPIVEKKKVQTGAPVDFKALMAAAESIAEGKKVNMEQLQVKSTKSAVQQQKESSQKSSLSASERERLREKERIREKEERRREKEREAEKQRHRDKNRASSSSAPKSRPTEMKSSSASSAEPKKVVEKPPVRKPFTKGPTPPPMIPAAIPGKKYLPGDVRYKEQMAMMKSGGGSASNNGAGNSSSSSASASATSNKDRISAVREAERQRERDREKQRSLKRARDEKMSRELEREHKIRKIGPNSSSSSGNSGNSGNLKRSYEARRMAELREQQMREKEKNKNKKKGRGESSGSFWKGGDDYTDEEMDDDQYDNDDYEDDDEMDDFIDDTEVDMDGMSRREFEDTLRMVNRKYDTDKWSRREKMISERDMESNYRRIQSEENFSKRAGFMEDLQEASKGRSVRL